VIEEPPPRAHDRGGSHRDRSVDEAPHREPILDDRTATAPVDGARREPTAEEQPTRIVEQGPRRPARRAARARRPWSATSGPRCVRRDGPAGGAGGQSAARAGSSTA
jgi:hypothetical protein